MAVWLYSIEWHFKSFHIKKLPQICPNICIKRPLLTKYGLVRIISYVAALLIAYYEVQKSKMLLYSLVVTTKKLSFAAAQKISPLYFSIVINRKILANVRSNYFFLCPFFLFFFFLVAWKYLHTSSFIGLWIFRAFLRPQITRHLPVNGTIIVTLPHAFWCSRSSVRRPYVRRAAFNTDL